MQNLFVLPVAKEASAMPPPKSPGDMSDVSQPEEQPFPNLLEKARKADVKAEVDQKSAIDPVMEIFDALLMTIPAQIHVPVSPEPFVPITPSEISDQQTAHPATAMVLTLVSPIGLDSLQPTRLAEGGSIVKSSDTEVSLNGIPFSMDDFPSPVDNITLLVNENGMNLSSQIGERSVGLSTQTPAQIQHPHEESIHTSGYSQEQILIGSEQHTPELVQEPISEKNPLASTNFSQSQKPTEGELPAPQPSNRGVGDPISSQEVTVKIAEPASPLSQINTLKSEPVFNFKPTEINLKVEVSQIGEQASGQQKVVSQLSNPILQYKPIESTYGETYATIKHPPPDSNLALENQQVTDLAHIESARLAEAHHPEIVDQLTRGVETLVKTGPQSIRLQLYPENMGKIDLRLASGVDGIRITIQADINTTSHLLEQHLPELRQGLLQSGINISNLSIGYGDPQSNLAGSHARRFDIWQIRKKTVAAPDSEGGDLDDSKKILWMSNIDYQI